MVDLDVFDFSAGMCSGLLFNKVSNGKQEFTKAFKPIRSYVFSNIPEEKSI